MGSASQQHWELIPKIEPIEVDDALDMDTVDAGELGFLEDPSKLDLDHLEIGMAAPGGSLASSGGESYPMFVDGGGAIDQKPLINHDCMWAGMCGDQSHPEKSGGGGGGCSHRQQHFRPLYLLQQQQQQHQQQTNNVEGVQQEATEQPQTLAGEDVAVPKVATMAMGGAISRPLVMQIGLERIGLIGRSLKPSVGPLTPFEPVQSSAQIPAGRSLLIRRHLQQQQQQPQPPRQQQQHQQQQHQQQHQRSVPALRLPQLAQGSFIGAKERQVVASAARPDTPLSLDDDPPEFKHTPVANPPQSTSSPGESRHLFNGNGVSIMASGGSTTRTSTSACASNYSSSSNATITTSTITTTNSSSSGSSNNVGRSGDGQCQSLQYYYNYLLDTTTTTTTTAMCTEHRRVNQLRQQLLILEEDPDEILLDGPTDSQLDYHTDDLRPDSSDNPLLQLLRDLRDIEKRSGETAMCGSLSSPFATSSSSSTLAAVPARGNALTVNGGSSSGNSGMMQFRSSLQDGGINLLDHRQEPAACRCEPRGDRPCALHSGGGSRPPTLSGARKRPYTWIGGVYDDEADDYPDDDEDEVVKQLELEKDDDGLLYVAGTRAELDGLKKSCPSAADDDNKDEEDEDENVCSVANCGCDWMQPLRGRRPRRTTVLASSAARSRSPQRQQQQQQQRTIEQKLVGPAVITMPTTGTLGAITATSASPNSSTMVASHSSGSSSYEFLQAMHVDDRSYTRLKGRYSMNELGVQTPSDSEEEIDVVSIGDKNLPTNPTARNRRQLESQVASKIRSASSRLPNGALHYNHHRHNTGADHHHLQQTPQHPKEAIGGVVAPAAVSVWGHQQQHLYPMRAVCHGGQGERSAGEGGQSSSVTSAKVLHNRRWTTSVNPADELDTSDRRNLLNNMERKRRIGMNNLFKELKNQIPSLRDKDRAPKVKILWEAAVLCTRLSRQADLIHELRQRRKKLYERIRHLRSSMQRQRQDHTNVHPIATID
uniref:Uncharacterized protein n=1 Tax=Anopheles atroparvus TaxID=41427 RepID=A0A182ILE2_ANOAO